MRIGAAEAEGADTGQPGAALRPPRGAPDRRERIATAGAAATEVPLLIVQINRRFGGLGADWAQRADACLRTARDAAQTAGGSP